MDGDEEEDDDSEREAYALDQESAEEESGETGGNEEQEMDVDMQMVTSNIDISGIASAGTPSVQSVEAVHSNGFLSIRFRHDDQRYFQLRHGHEFGSALVPRQQHDGLEAQTRSTILGTSRRSQSYFGFQGLQKQPTRTVFGFLEGLGFLQGVGGFVRCVAQTVEIRPDFTRPAPTG